MQLLKKINKLSSAHQITIIFSVWALSLFLVSQIYFCGFNIRECLQLSAFGNWDGEHFLRIINQGYINDYSFAFFPLFPVVVQVIHFFLPLNLVLTGLLLNLAFTWIGVFYLFKLLTKEFKKKQILWILLMILSFPLSFFFLVFYSEALFFALSVMSIYFYKQKKYATAVFLLTLLTLTRMAGVALVVAILIDVWRKKELRPLFLLPFLGVGSFIFAAFIKTGNWFATISAETNWERLVTLPGFAIFNSISVLLREGISYKNYAVFLDLVVVILTVVLLFRSFKVIPRLYWNYTLLSLLIPLSTSTFLSFPRFLIVLFPLFIAFSLGSNTIVRTVYIVCGLFFLHMLFILFLQGGWVA